MLYGTHVNTFWVPVWEFVAHLSKRRIWQYWTFGSFVLQDVCLRDVFVHYDVFVLRNVCLRDVFIGPSGCCPSGRLSKRRGALFWEMASFGHKHVLYLWDDFIDYLSLSKSIAYLHIRPFEPFETLHIWRLHPWKFELLQVLYLRYGFANPWHLFDIWDFSILIIYLRFIHSFLGDIWDFHFWHI